MKAPESDSIARSCNQGQLLETFQFGEKNQYFGAYWPPGPSSRPPSRCLFVFPWGQEYYRCHRVMLHMAGELASQGVHSFVFDFQGTGDSAGDHLDLSYTSACRDAKAAANEFSDIAGDDPLTIVGIRLGGNVALEIAGAAKARQIVVWDPVISGQHYLQENRRLHQEMCEDPYRFPKVRNTPSDEILGFRYSQAALQEVSELALNSALLQSRKRRLKISGIAPNPEQWGIDTVPDIIDVGEIREPDQNHWENYRTLELALTPGDESRFIVEQVVARK